MHVGATLAVARDTGERFFAALRMTGTEDVSKAPLLKGAVSLKADWRIHSRL
jgi:hypothetical protein